MEGNMAQSLAAGETPAREAATPAPPANLMGAQLYASTLLTVLIVLLALSAYHYWVAPRPTRVATVDLSEVLDLKQLQVTAQSMKAGATDKDRAAAFDEIGRFARDMEAGVAELARECDCVLLVRAAVVKGVAEDLTPALKKKMDMDRVSAADMVQAIVGKRPDPAAAALRPPVMEERGRP
jgi:hypothetical protein